MSIKHKITALLSSLLLLNCGTMSAFAESVLPEGAVKGLPEKLTAMDSDGKPVNSETGEYFFHVEGMEFGEIYTKNIQIMNLRDDKAYHIYFYVEPLFKDGEIDLEKGCECEFYLDEENFFKGSVWGEGNMNLQNEVVDCGFYAPGDSHTLKCNISWNRTGMLTNVDNGYRIIDNNGENIIIDKDEDGHAEGEIEFKWIFYAAVDEDYEAPYTGFLDIDSLTWLIISGIFLLLILVMLILIYRKKRRKTE